MAGFMRSVVWQFWAAVLLLSDMLVHLVRAATLEENSNYQACVANPSGCTSLFIHANSLSGTIPTEMGELTSLGNLFIHGNPLSGTIPTEIGEMTSLTKLALASVSLSGTIPTEISTLKSLWQLNLLDNSLSGTIPTEIGEMTLLRDVRLFGNSLSSTIPTVLGEMTRLTLLWLWSNSLSGNIPTEMGELTSLGSLDLKDNAGLCGDVVSVGTVGTSYDTSGTALGTACPVSPTGSPTAPTVSPTTMSPTVLPTVSPSMHPTSMHPTSMHPTSMHPTSMHPTTASPTLFPSMSPTLPSFAPSTPTKPFIKAVLVDGQLIVDADLSQLEVGLTPMNVEADTSTDLTINATLEIEELREPDSTDSTSASVGPVPSLFLLMCVVGLAVTAMVTIKRRRAASADRSTHEDMPLFTDYPRYS